MTAVLDQPPTRRPSQAGAAPDPPAPRRRSPLAQRRWHRYTAVQLLVLILATIPVLVAAGAIGAGLAGLVPLETMLTVALAAGETPGMLVFAAMFLASPMQWLTGRSQVRVRKYLGVAFYLLALSNGAMFVVERGLGPVLSSPFLVAGTVALALATPLVATSSRWSQRVMGMRRWRLLHKLTYAIAAALVAHVVLMGDPDPGSVLIVAGFVARIPAVRRWLTRSGRTDRTG